MDILIWDIEEPKPASSKLTIFWSRNSNESNSISIVKYVEENSDEIRAQYLEWIYDLGQSWVDEKRVIDHLLIRKNLSYWWLSSLPQKVNIDKSQNINDSIKLLGLEKFIKENNPKSISIASKNNIIVKIIENLCSLNNINFSRIKTNKKFTIKKFPTAIAIIYYTWYFFRSLPVLLQKKSVISSNNNNVMLIDIFTHIYNSSYKDNQFKSYYWEDLVTKLKEWNIKTNWLHIYYKNNSNKSLLYSENLCEKFSKKSNGMQNHYLIESHIDLRIFCRALADYVKIRLRTKLIPKLHRIKPKDSKLDLWELHSRDWYESLAGKNLVKNCMAIALFEAFMKKIPKQKIGVYISENQPWELALIYAWQTANHGVLVGTPHNTLRYWDLRHHFDSRTYKELDVTKYPMPSLLAVNGPVAMKHLSNSGYPKNQLREVEALRYQYLLKNKKKNNNNNTFNILICADYQYQNIIKIMDILLSIRKDLPKNTTIIYRPHPIYNFSIKKYNINLNIIYSEKTLMEDLLSVDVVIVGLISSSAADAYTLGLPVIQVLDGSSLNLSPLRSIKNACFISSGNELISELNNLKVNSINNDKYFNLEENIVRWKSIFDQYL